MIFFYFYYYYYFIYLFIFFFFSNLPAWLFRIVFTFILEQILNSLHHISQLFISIWAQVGVCHLVTWTWYSILNG